MSGDAGYPVAVDAAAMALRRHPHLRLILVGAAAELEKAVAERALDFGARLQIEPATEVVSMDESPAKALRGKKDSSMRVALNLVQQGRAQACVSAGNTGALMATARYVLKMLPGIDRPAIISAMPSQNGHTHMLDLGANAECTAEHLAQFAVMGAVVAAAVSGLERPRVALLNIGHESIKGNQVTKAAAELLEASELNFVGYIEGDGIYVGDVDVVVCDGFTGNIALKASEGTAKLISAYLRAELTRTWWSRLAAVLIYPVLRRFQQRADPRAYNGASFVGLQGIVIKSHGSADALAMANAIHIADLEVEKSVPSRISRLLDQALLPARTDALTEPAD